MKVYLVLALFLGVLAGAVQAQAPYRCSFAQTVPYPVRVEDHAALVGDMLIQCQGGTVTPAGSAIPLVNIQILTNANVTSKILGSGGTTYSEAMLTIDEPAPAQQRVCDAGGAAVVAGTKCGSATVATGVAGSSPYLLNNGGNVYQGAVVLNNSVLWTGVPIDPPGTTNPAFLRYIRITNIRADANQLGVSTTLVPTAVLAFVSAAPNTALPVSDATQTVAFIGTGLTFSANAGANPSSTANLPTAYAQGNDHNATITPTRSGIATDYTVTFQEGLTTAFRLANVSGYIPPDADQSTLGTNYGTESGFYNQTAMAGNAAGAGMASSATRVMAKFAGIPSGVMLYVTISNTNTTIADNPTNAAAVLVVDTDNNGNGGSFAVAGNAAGTVFLSKLGLFPITSTGNGAGIAVWEVTKANLNVLDQLSFGVTVSYTANPAQNLPAPGTSTVAGTFAPTSTTTTATFGSPAPRFADTSGGNITPAFTINPCMTDILLATNPVGLSIVVDGSTLTAPQTLQWIQGSQHTIGVSSPQGGGGTRYPFSNWSDGGSETHALTVPSTSTTYTANFATQYLLTTQASPPAGGGIAASPASTDGYYTSGASVQLTAAANSGYQFANWSGDLTGTANPQPVTMSAPHSATANFAAVSTILVTTAPTGLALSVDGAMFTAPQAFNWVVGSSHSIGATPPQGTSGMRYVVNWSDGGAETHNIATPASATTYTANLTTQYLLTASVSPSAGGTVTANPSSVDGYYPSGSSVQLTAAASSGSAFAGWTGDLTGTTNPQAVTMSAPRNVAADFLSGAGFYAVAPCRVVDTRANGKSGPFGPPGMSRGSTRDFAIASSSCAIPASALAYSLNITVVPPAPLTYLSVWPTGQAQPVVSTLNSFDGRVVANAAIVPAGTNGSISVFASDATDVIIDINGYFAPPGQAFGSLAFYPATPCRVADTRLFGGKTGAFGPPSMGAGTNRSFPVPAGTCGIPASAQAYSLNITVVPPSPLGYLTTWPAGQPQPVVSTLNSYDGSVVANAAIVPAGTSGSISVFVSNATDVIVDINGYFAPPGSPGAMYFYPATPCRIADTRPSGGKTGAWGPPSMTGGAIRDFPIASSSCGLPSTAQAYSLNLTVVPPGPLTYLSAWPSGESQPVVSTLNSFAGKVVANAAIVPAGTGGAISVYATNPTDLIIDVSGYFAP